MPKVVFVIEPDLDKELRDRIRGRGDISKIMNVALRRYFSENNTH